MTYLQKTAGSKAAACGGWAAFGEYFFAMAAIAVATGAYCHVLFPGLKGGTAALFILISITLINLWGVSQSAQFEMGVTLLALLGIALTAIFIGHKHSAWVQNPFTQHISSFGFIQAVPFLLWLYLGIEGSVLSAEEVKHPQKSLPKAIGWAMPVLIISAFLVVVMVGGHTPYSQIANDNPLPVALTYLYGGKTFFVKTIVLLGLCGLLASFNGMQVACSRQIYALARAGYAPGLLCRLSKNQTPTCSLIVVAVLCGIAMSIVSVTGLLHLAILGALLVYMCGVVVWFLYFQNHSINKPAKLAYYKWGLLTAMLLFCLLAVMRYFFIAS